MRAFVALDLPQAALASLARLQAGLSVGRIVPEQNLHLTLAFLGDVAEPHLSDLAEALHDLDLPPVSLSLQGLDLFGSRHPSVLYVPAAGEGLERLHAKVMRAVRDAGITMARERFRPHVTIARFGREMSARDQARLGEFLMLNARFTLPPARCETMTLYRSHLRPDGAVHEALAVWPFAR